MLSDIVWSKRKTTYYRGFEQQRWYSMPLAQPETKHILNSLLGCYFESVHTCSSLKMLYLYLYTLIISHKSCNILSILNKLTLQKMYTNPCRSRELNPGPITQKADAFFLPHRVNIIRDRYRHKIV